MPNEYKVHLQRSNGDYTSTTVFANSEYAAMREAQYYHRELTVIRIERVTKPDH